MPHQLEDLQNATVIIGAAGLAGTGITEGEKTYITSRLDALDGHGLGDHPDVVLTTPQEGDSLVVDAEGRFVNRPAAEGGVPLVRSDALSVENVTTLSFGAGLTMGASADPNRANVFPQYGTQPQTVAEGSHLHPVPVETRHVLPDPASLAVIHSGSRDLVTATVGTFAVDVPTKVDVIGYLHGEGVDDPVIFDLEILIDGQQASTADIPSTQKPTFEWGVNGQWSFRHSRVITRTAAQSGTRNVTFRVRWQGWGGLKVHQAWCHVIRTAYR